MPEVPNYKTEEKPKEESKEEPKETKVSSDNTHPVYDEKFSKDHKFYRSKLVPGLSVQIGDEPERNELPTNVSFTPYNFFSEKTGDSYQVGYLATDEQEAQEILADDFNAEEITEKEYKDEIAKALER